MLKALWRKLGAEFMPADGVAHDDRAFPNADFSGHAGGVRVLPHITHTGEFHLERLTRLLRARYGKTLLVPEFSGLSDQALKELVSLASRIQDQDIQRELLLFYLNCSPVIQEFLRSETPLGQDRLVVR